VGEGVYTMGWTCTSSVCGGGVLRVIDNPVAQDLEKSQSKLINARWIVLAATKNEPSLGVFRDGLTIINLFKWKEISKGVTDISQAMYHSVVALFLNTAALKQICYFVLEDLIKEIIAEFILFFLMKDSLRGFTFTSLF